ncbi:hypothetical protein AMS68_003307 [Peltaster fructicola]|uniref:Uncharacterized protein n=1 Tax=Peltaster fructicola TaxID=286661 RepID=A0A6H0XTK0_9PEZI|nr:hypothetical protein AMS68_003307 [Peltaster fructicola]
MTDAIPAIAASESKVAFMAALGFELGKPEHERLYKLMKEEAVQEYRSVIQDRRAMSPADEHDDPTKPRYAYTQIDKPAIHKAIASIYARAGAETRALYDRGREPGGSTDSNWIIRWMLYHCFRYRDGRNKRSGSSVIQERESGIPPTNTVPVEPMPTRRSQESTRNNITGVSPPDSTARPVGRPLPYDPVRA